MIIEEIKRRISEEIMQSGLRQSEIAKRLGIKQPTVYEYVKMISLPSLDTLAKLCILLDLDANYILGITDYSGKRIN